VTGVVGFERARLGVCTQRCSGPSARQSQQEIHMTWTKPEAEVVAVTMEVTAYVATL
jgi:hypothetical protein